MIRTHVEHWSGRVPGYGAALPGGRYAVYVPGRLASSDGNLPLPGDPTEPAGFLDVMERDGLLLVVCAGQATDTAWLWNGVEWHALGHPAYGMDAVVFNPVTDEVWITTDGLTATATHLETGAVRTFPFDAGSQGFGQVNPDGTVVPAWQHYIDSARGLCVYTDFGDVAIGQGVDDGLVARFADDGIVRELAAGIWRSPRPKRAGDQFAITAVAERDGYTQTWWPTLADLRALPPLVHVDPIVAIGRPVWAGFFMFTQGPAAPGNCTLAVRHVAGPQSRPVIVCAETVDTVSGTVLGYFCGGGTVEEAEAEARRVRALGYRPVVYWDSRSWPRPPVLPAGSWVCVQAYRHAGERLDDFEASIRQQVAAVPAGHGVALVAQCYTSNASLSTDLSSLVPVFARLARDLPRIVAVLAFSGAGRDTGLESHPDVRPLWERLVAGIPAAPALDWPPTPTPKPRPTPTPGPTPDPVPVPTSPPKEPESMDVVLSEASYLNWRYGGGQSLDPPTNPHDKDRRAFEHGRKVAGGDETAHAEKLSDGSYGLQSPNRRSWLSIQADGSLQERAVVEGEEPGPWERFDFIAGSFVERAKDGITRAPVELL